jgi:hypothetical protein
MFTILRRGRQATGGRVSEQEHSTSKADEHWRPFEHDNALRHPATLLETHTYNLGSHGDRATVRECFDAHAHMRERQ